VIVRLTAVTARYDAELSWHEAGHGIAAISCGCTVSKIEQGNAMGGRSDGVAGTCWHTVASVFGDEIVITLAGPVAEGTVSGKLAPPDRAEFANYLRKAKN